MVSTVGMLRLGKIDAAAHMQSFCWVLKAKVSGSAVAPAMCLVARCRTSNAQIDQRPLDLISCCQADTVCISVYGGHAKLDSMHTSLTYRWAHQTVKGYGAT